MAEWDWLKGEAEEQAPKNMSKLFSIGLKPGTILVRGVPVEVGDTELAVEFIKTWAKSGMSREDIEELLLETIPN